MVLAVKTPVLEGIENAPAISIPCPSAGSFICDMAALQGSGRLYSALQQLNPDCFRQ